MTSFYDDLWLPENAPRDADTSIAVPTGWELTSNTTELCATCPNSCKQYTTFSMRACQLDEFGDPVSPAAYHDYLINQEQLGSQNPYIFAQYLYKWNRLQQLLYWMAVGYPFGSLNWLYSGIAGWPTGTPLILRTVAPHTGYPSEPNCLYVDALDWDTEDAPDGSHVGAFSPGLYMIEPGGMITIGSSVSRHQFQVVRVDYSTDPVKVYLHRDIGEIPASVYVFYVHEFSNSGDRTGGNIYPNYTYPAPSVSFYVQARTKDWYNGDGCYLTKIDDTNGRIAYPIQKTATNSGTFRVTATKSDGGTDDITGDVLHHFGEYANTYGNEHRLIVYYDVAESEFRTWLDLSAWKETYTEFCVYYCIETTSQTNTTVLENASAWKPTQMMCVHCMRDFSNSYASISQNAAYSDTRAYYGSGIDANGDHWFCAKLADMDESDVYEVTPEALSRFRPGCCYSTDCKKFEINTPWFLKSQQIKDLFLGRGLFLEQITAPGPGLWEGEMKWSTQPGLFFLAGMPSPTYEHSIEPHIFWEGANEVGSIGSYGYLGTDIDGNENQVIFGAMANAYNNFEGVLSKVNYAQKYDRIGGIGSSEELRRLFDDGSDHYLMQQDIPGRNLPYASRAVQSLAPDGYGEAGVQTVRQMPLVLSGFLKGQGTSAYQTRLTWPGAGVALIQVYGIGGGIRDKGRPLIKGGMSTLARTVAAYDILDYGGETVLALHFYPVVRVNMQASGGSDMPFEFVSGGGTVRPPEWLQIFDPFENEYYGGADTGLMRGDTVTFSMDDAALYGLPEDVQLTCIYAQAFGGYQYTGEALPGLEGGTVPITKPAGGSTHPAFYDIPQNRLSMDFALFDLHGYKAQELLAWFNLHPAFTNLTVTIKSNAVFPPKIYHLYNGNVYPTNYDLRIQHYEDQSLIKTLTSETDFNYDPSNGLIQIPATETDTWSSTASHCLNIQDISGSKPWLVSRENTRPASVVEDIISAFQALMWTEARNPLTNQFIMSVVSGYAHVTDIGGWINMHMYSVEKPYLTFPVATYEANPDVYIRDVVGDDVIEHTNIALLRAPTGTTLTMEVGGHFQVETLQGADDKTIPYVISYPNMKCSLPVTQITNTVPMQSWTEGVENLSATNIVGRCNPDWIEQVLIDVQVGLSDFTYQTSTPTYTYVDFGTTTSTVETVSDTSYQPSLTLAGGWFYFYEDDYQNLLGETFEDYKAIYAINVVGTPITVSPEWPLDVNGFPTGLSAWTTVDITDIVKALSVNIPEASAEFCLFPGGMNPSLALRQFNSGLKDFLYCYANINEIDYREHPESEARGHVESQPFGGGCSTIATTYTHFNLRHLRVKLDHAALLADVDKIPHICFGGPTKYPWPAR